MNKKGVISFAITAGLLLALALVLLVFFSGFSLVYWLMSRTIFALIGGTMLVMFAVTAFKGKIMPVWLWIVAIGLLVLPTVFEGLKSITLASVLP